jgi:pyruvate/2-oxoglutarate dehydrogenase complex dihydrolipoamide acyltransferase (E2) component
MGYGFAVFVNHLSCSYLPRTKSHQDYAWVHEDMIFHLMVYLGLTFDHRTLDGAIGDQFMTKVKEFFAIPLPPKVLGHLYRA